MTPAGQFARWAPQLLAAAERGDPALLAHVRQALLGLAHYDLPLGWKHVPDPTFPQTVAWVLAIHEKLQSPNVFMRDWRIRKSLRAKWGSHLRSVITKVEQFASWGGLVDLGRAPACHDRMAIQVVRLVPSVREFLRDDDNTAFCVKSAGDALKDVGLVKEDRREWLRYAPILQDVSPIGVPVTVFILRPLPLALPPGVPHVHDPSSQSARRQGRAEDRGAEEGRALSRPRRRAGPRAVDA